MRFSPTFDSSCSPRLRRSCLKAAVVLIVAALVAALPHAAHAAPAGDETLALGKSYPLEIRVKFHVALFHWIDSVVGTSGGKTMAAHQKEFRTLFGRGDLAERDLMQRFRAARIHDNLRPAAADAEGAAGSRGRSALLATFLAAEDLESALKAAEAEMDADDFVILRLTLEFFQAKYERIWKEGEIPRRFVERVRKDPRRKILERLLTRMAGFYGVDMADAPRPVVVPVPVPPGQGTHATAVGRFLLIEVRSPDHLPEQASVIVHENAHFLYSNMEKETLERFAALADSLPPPAQAAWMNLSEALPTALGQGVADERHRPQTWSRSNPWYHLVRVDEYAKRLYPLVKETLDGKGRFDETFLRRALDLY